MKKKKTETVEKCEKKQPSGANKALKIIMVVLNTIINIMIVIVLIVSLLVAALALTTKNNKNSLPNIFGFTVQYVQTPSMDVPSPDGYEGGPFTEEDVLIGKIYDIDKTGELEVGDIITYLSNETDEQGNNRMITHRIVDKKMIDGDYVYQTWGDNRDIAQVPDQLTVEDYISGIDIIAVNYTSSYHGAILKNCADFLRTLRSPGGFFGIILIPMIIFFLYAIVRVVINAMNYKKEKSEDEKEAAEKEKQNAIDEAVAAALAEKDAAGEAKTETPADMTPEQMEQFKQFLAFQKAQQSAETSEPDETPDGNDESAEDAPDNAPDAD